MKRRSRIVEHFVPFLVPVNRRSRLGPEGFGISKPTVVDVLIGGGHSWTGFTRFNQDSQDASRTNPRVEAVLHLKIDAIVSYLLIMPTVLRLLACITAHRT